MLLFVLSKSTKLKPRVQYTHYCALLDQSDCRYMLGILDNAWRRVTTTVKLHSIKPEIRFCAVSNPTRGMSQTCDCENV